VCLDEPPLLQEDCGVFFDLILEYDRDYSRYAVGSLCRGILHGFESEYFSRAAPGVQARNLDPVHNISLDYVLSNLEGASGLRLTP